MKRPGSEWCRRNQSASPASEFDPPPFDERGGIRGTPCVRGDRGIGSLSGAFQPLAPVVLTFRW